MALFEKLFGKRDCEICGGDMASVDDMATLAAKIVTYCYPKVS